MGSRFKGLILVGLYKVILGYLDILGYFRIF